MVRACCVLNCTSSGTMPSHNFPKDETMRKKWMMNLLLKPYSEDEIFKLRVCYKHFKKSDYSGSTGYRRLIRAAIPSMETCQLHEPIAAIEENMKTLFEQQEKQQENVTHIQIDVANLSEQQAQMQMQHDRDIQALKKQMQLLQAQSVENTRTRTCNLVEVTRKSMLSPAARRLYDNNIKLQAQKRRMKRQLKTMKQRNETVTLKRRVDNSREDKDTKVREGFINMMIRNNDVPPQARRYTLEDKMFCLGIYRRSRSSYNYISKYLLCPSYTSLNTQLNRVPIDTGCNNSIIRYLRSTAEKIEPKDLYIALLWDEMAIQPFLQYDVKNEKIVGFEDWGMRRTRKFADHAIVFYIRCLASGHKLPIGYGFCNSTTTSVQLSRCIKEWLKVLQSCGFKPVATICDQGGSNIAAINMLIAETRRQHLKNNMTPPVGNIFCIGPEEYIVPLFDYVHLQKGVRNNLLDKDLLLNKHVTCSERESQCASWDDITAAYVIDRKCFPCRRKMKKLTDKHTVPHLIPKMKVKYAVQVLSHTVADFIDMVLTFTKEGVVQVANENMHLPTSAAVTAKTIYFFDDLFDSFNGNSEQGLTSIITENSKHLKFWQEALQKLKKMEFVEKKTHTFLRRNKPKCLVNWIRTIQGVKCLWRMLQTHGFTTLNLKYLNQDCVENFFSQIRNHGHQNTNPTPYMFGASFKALLTCNLTSKHSISANCQEDKESFLPLLTLMREGEVQDMEKDNRNVECDEPAIIDESDNLHASCSLDVEKIINIIKKKSTTTCAQCTAMITTENTTKVLKNAITVAANRLPDFCYVTKIKQKLTNIVNQEVFSTPYFHCNNVQDTVLNILTHHVITEWCNIINKILQQKIKDDLNRNYMHFQAHRMSLKYCKKKSSEGTK